MNAELASHLTGFGVDIISHTDLVKREAEKTRKDGLLIDLKGIGEKMVFNLNNHSIYSVKDLSSADESILEQIPGIGMKTAKKLINMANDYFKSREKSSDKSSVGTNE